MKTLIWILLLLPILSQAQNLVQEAPVQTTEVHGKGYHGYIFPMPGGFYSLGVIPDGQTAYAPTKEDVEKAEAILQKQIAALNKKREHQSGKCPIIDEKLHHYTRQYFGCKNKDGHTIVWVNAIWKDLDRIDAGQKYFQVNDGCSYYWDVSIDLTSSKAYDLDVNGEG